MTGTPIEKRILPSRAKRRICFFLCLCLCLCVLAAAASRAESKRPKILGIRYVRFAVSDFCKARDFYMRILGHSLECQAGEKSAGGPVLLNATQLVALSPRRSSVEAGHQDAG